MTNALCFTRFYISQRYFGTLEEANEAVLKGEAWGSIHIRSNFSNALIDRALYGVETTNDTIMASTIDVRLDMTSNERRPRHSFCAGGSELQRQK
jgi:hypothetical protein